MHQARGHSQERSTIMICLFVVVLGPTAVLAQAALPIRSSNCDVIVGPRSVLKEIADCLARADRDCRPAGFRFKQFAMVDTRDGSGGYVVIKDVRGATQLLLIPTRAIPGIEGNCLIDDPAVPNYFRAAWEASAFLARSTIEPGRPAVSLVVNPKPGRRDGQLHIHIDWLRQRILDQLADLNLRERWSSVTLQVDGREYQYKAMQLRDSQFNFLPFKMAATVPDLKEPMEDRTIVVIEMNRGSMPKGFILLIGETPDEGEVLQTNDHSVMAR